MPTLSYPGVYIQEVSSGVRPIEIASTSTPAFVGLAEMGPTEPKRVTSWTEYQRTFGGFITDGKLAHSVFAFFNNGGRQCYIVRVLRHDAATATVTVQNRASSPTNGLKFSAKNEGTWGNFLYLQIEDGTLDPGNEFKLSVRRQVEAADVPMNFRDIAPLEVFDNLSMDSRASNYVISSVNQSSSLVEAQVHTDNVALQHGFHRGDHEPSLPLDTRLSLQINLDSDGFQVVNLPDTVKTETELSKIATEIQKAVRLLIRKKTSTNTAAFLEFTCETETENRLVLRSGSQSEGSSVLVWPAVTNDAVEVLKLKSDNSVHKGKVLLGGLGSSLPLANRLSLQINLDSDGFQSVTLPDPVKTEEDLSKVAEAIQNAVRGLTKIKPATSATAFTGFTCKLATRLVLKSGTASAASSVRIQPAVMKDATGLLKLGAGNGGQSQDGLALRRPANADVVQVGDAAKGDGIVMDVQLGTDGDQSQHVAETTFSTAFSRLDTVTDFSLLAVPGEGTTAMMDLGMAYCANRPLQDVFYIGEMASDDDTPDEAIAFRKRLTTANSYGALYFPWVKALDPTGQSREAILVPPSGYVAGLYARIDASRGVWKAPAGTEASLNGVVGLAVDLTDVQQGNLNPWGVNVIRRFPTAGVIAFGARTITSDSEWKYVPVRRTAIMLRVSIRNGIQWAVFEPNDEPLWSQLRLNLNSFMMTLFRQGAFQGSTPSQAFFVKCDGETTTQSDIDLGIVNILVGFAPLKPAEFIVVKISQKAGQASA